MDIIKDFIPVGQKNRPGRVNPCKYITIHNTGNTDKGADAKAHASYIKSEAAANIPASWHYTVDDKVIYQHLPDNEIAWHAGDGNNGIGNNQSIGIEICVNVDCDLTRAADNAADLTAMLMRKHNIPIANVWQHFNWSGKNCPEFIRKGKPYDWETFLKRVESAYSSTKICVGNKQKEIPAVLIDGRWWVELDSGEYVWLRHCAEALGFRVEWNEKTEMVELLTDEWIEYTV